jgi:hypothetical protein
MKVIMTATIMKNITSKKTATILTTTLFIIIIITIHTMIHIGMIYGIGTVGVFTAVFTGILTGILVHGISDGDIPFM